MYSAWFMFDNHTFKKVEELNLDNFIETCKKCFELDKDGLLGHIKHNEEEVFPRDSKYHLFNVTFRLEDIGALKERILKTHSYSI